LRTFDRPGLLIWASAHEQPNIRKKIKILLAGFVAQELKIKNPEGHNIDLRDKDYNEAFELCKKYVAGGQDIEQMTSKQKDKFYENVESELKKIKDEIKEELQKVPTDLLNTTVAYMAQYGQMNALEYFALQRQLLEKKNKKASEDKQAPASPAKGTPGPVKPPAAVIANAAKKAPAAAA
jgi:hypothetical protein